MQQKTNNIQRINRIKVLLGLGFSADESVKSSSKSSEDDCPNEETIACYFDNVMSAKENNEFISLLSHCPKSYSLWISMCETLAQLKQITDKQATKSMTKTTLFDYLIKLFSSNKNTFAGGLATAFLFFMVVNFSFIPFAKLPIDKQIVKIWESQEVLDLAYIDISEFTPRAGVKSSFNIMPFPEKVAFSSGFKQGLINMSSVSETIKSNDRTLDFINSLPSEPLYCATLICKEKTQLNRQLGIWSSFALQECQQNQYRSKTYWKKQNIVIKHFINKYNKLSTSNTLVERVNNIGDTLQTLTTGKTDNFQNNQFVVCNTIKQMTFYSIQEQL